MGRLLKVIQTGEGVLRKPSRKLTLAEIKSDDTQQLIDLMIATLRDKPGVGLAAPQVGESLQIVIIEDKKKYQSKLPAKVLTAQKRKPVGLKVIINPVLTIAGTDHTNFFEGCLSVDGYRAVVPRARKVEVTGLDRNGKEITIKADGWLARILQHEVDHLNGVLYVDTMHPQSFVTEHHFKEEWSEAMPSKITKFIS